MKKTPLVKTFALLLAALLLLSLMPAPAYADGAVALSGGEGAYYVNLSETGTDTLDLTGQTTGFSFTVYDNGGADGQYANYCETDLVITAPANCLLSVSGSGVTEGASCDYLKFYSGDSPTALGNGAYGGTFTVDALVSSSNVLKIHFHSDSGVVRDGFALTVTLVDLSAYGRLSYTYATDTRTSVIGKGTEIALPAFTEFFTLPERYHFVCWQLGESSCAEGAAFTVTGDAAFTAVLEADPVIVSDNYGRDSIVLPKSTSITADLSDKAEGYELWAYDPGGSGYYPYNCDGSATVIAPAGCQLFIDADVATEERSDWIYLYDGDSTSAPLLGQYSGSSASISAVTTTSGKLTIRFTSDPRSNYRGFDMRIRVFRPASLVTLSFAPGEGSGTMDPITRLPGDRCYLPSCGFTLPENTYFDYYTDGVNNYRVNDSFTFGTSDVTLTAVYIPKYTLTYDNGLTTVVQNARQGATPSLPRYMQVFDRLPYRKNFLYWESGGATYSPGTYITVNANMTFTAVFEDLPVLIDDGSGGTYVLMPEAEDAAVDLSDKPNCFTFSVYDAGGQENYTNNNNGSLTFTAPAGYVFAVSGSGQTETGCDLLSLYDSDGTTPLGGGVFSDSFTIDTLTTGANVLKIAFSSDNLVGYSGFELSVTMYDPATQRTLSFSPGEGGSGAMDAVTVFSGLAFELPACGFTPPAGRVFLAWTDGTNTYRAGQTVVFTDDTLLTALWAESVSVTYVYDGTERTVAEQKDAQLTLPAFTELFDLPNHMLFTGWQEAAGGAVYQAGDTCLIHEPTVFNALLEPEPVLISDGEGGWYVNMPSVRGDQITAILSDKPEGFSFTVYDDGGRTSRYSNGCDGCLTVVAPEGYLVTVSGTGTTESGYDFLQFFDGTSISDPRLGSAKYSGNGLYVNALLTTGRYLTIRFYSDGSDNYSGFALTVTLVEPATLTYVYGTQRETVSVMKGDELSIAEFEDLFELPYGQTFVGWQDGTDWYYPDEDVVMNASLTLTAVLETMPTATLDGSGALLLAAYGGDGILTVSPPFPFEKNTEIELPQASEFFEVPDGKIFGGWRINGTIYGAGERLSASEDITLTAVWLDPTPWDLLAETLNAAPGTDLGTIALTSDLVGSSGSAALTVPEGVTVTLDLAGHSIDGSATALARGGVAISARGTLTVVDSIGGGAIRGGVQIFGTDGFAAPAAVTASYAARVELKYRADGGDVWSRYLTVYYPTVREALLRAYAIGETYEAELPAHDASETYVVFLADTVIPAGETWEVYTGAYWIDLDLNGHVFDVQGTLGGSSNSELYIDSGVPGVFRSGGRLNSSMVLLSGDPAYLTGGEINGTFRTHRLYDGTVTVSGGVFNNEFSIGGGAVTISGGSFYNWCEIEGGAVTISGGFFDEDFTIYGGAVTISGGTFIDWVNFDNFYRSSVVTLTGEAELGGLYFEIDRDEDSAGMSLTIDGNARIAETGYHTSGGGAGSKPTVFLNGGYYGEDPQTWADDATLSAALTFVFSGPVETYNGQADWAYDIVDYPWRVSDGALSGLVQEPDGSWAYYANGVIDYAYEGLASRDDIGWWYVKNGTIDFGYTGLINSPAHGWWYVTNGQLTFDATGLAYREDIGWWYVENSQITFTYTGLAEIPGYGWYYVENSHLTFAANGLVNTDTQGWWYVVNSQVDFGFVGIAEVPGVGWFYVHDGRIDFGANGFVNTAAQGWWYVLGGQVRFDFTGVAEIPGVGWYYAQNGQITFTYNGTVTQDGVTYDIVNSQATPRPAGPVKEGLVQDEDGVWRYYVNGAVASGYTGLVNSEQVGWWYVVNGVIDFGYTGIAEIPGNGWWYVRNGTIDFGANGLVNTPAQGWWYLVNGQVDFGFVGIAEVANVGWWYVRNGQIDFGANGFVNTNAQGWWYVLGGQVRFDFTGVAEIPGVGWYYAQNGQITFSYNGQIEQDGTTWNVVNSQATPV